MSSIGFMWNTEFARDAEKKTLHQTGDFVPTVCTKETKRKSNDIGQ